MDKCPICGNINVNKMKKIEDLNFKGFSIKTEFEFFHCNRCREDILTKDCLKNINDVLKKVNITPYQ